MSKEQIGINSGGFQAFRDAEGLEKQGGIGKHLNTLISILPMPSKDISTARIISRLVCTTAPKEIVYMDKDNFICPMPLVWNEIYENLVEARDKMIEQGTEIPEPPKPLILAGWHLPHIQKNARWQETLTWAEKYKLANLIPELEEEQKFYG